MPRTAGLVSFLAVEVFALFLANRGTWRPSRHPPCLLCKQRLAAGLAKSPLCLFFAKERRWGPEQKSEAGLRFDLVNNIKRNSPTLFFRPDQRRAPSGAPSHSEFLGQPNGLWGSQMGPGPARSAPGQRDRPRDSEIARGTAKSAPRRPSGLRDRQVGPGIAKSVPG